MDILIRHVVPHSKKETEVLELSTIDSYQHYFESYASLSYSSTFINESNKNFMGHTKSSDPCVKLCIIRDLEWNVRFRMECVCWRIFTMMFLALVNSYMIAIR
ncbi:hypothetical protein KP509_17G053100 [Ceratopteris richardii]|uniref:Uncharacterized protein n=1 Tax=Ceratopteris richardii TaxID=49495 RepID=A0A8T2SUB4_CERRI|nr:hypothetical protein KP509_17G053100 [Ceratopteris richardii]